MSDGWACSATSDATVQADGQERGRNRRPHRLWAHRHVPIQISTIDDGPRLRPSSQCSCDVVRITHSKSVERVPKGCCDRVVLRGERASAVVARPMPDPAPSDDETDTAREFAEGLCSDSDIFDPHRLRQYGKLDIEPSAEELVVAGLDQCFLHRSDVSCCYVPSLLVSIRSTLVDAPSPSCCTCMTRSVSSATRNASIPAGTPQ